MFWILICTILSLIIFIYDMTCYEEKLVFDFETIFCSIIMMVVGAFVGGCLYLLIGIGIADSLPKEYVSTKQELSMIDDSKNYYLVDDINNDIYYYKIENDTIKKITIDKSNIEIKEESIEKPYLIEYKGKFKKDWYNWFAIDWAISEKYEFNRWYFGHYHEYKQINSQYVLLYGDIVTLEYESIFE